MEREFAEKRHTVGCEGDKDLSPIRHPPASRDKSLAHRPVNQLDRAVMLQLQPLREIADRRAFPLREALQGEHQLVLLRFQSRRVSRLLAEMDEAPDLKAELRQRSVFVNGNLALAFRFHRMLITPHDAKYIVSRYDCITVEKRRVSFGAVVSHDTGVEWEAEPEQ